MRQSPSPELPSLWRRLIALCLCGGLCGAGLLGMGLLTGCAGLGGRRAAAQNQAIANPVFVTAPNREIAWEKTVDVVHDYFEIARENRLDGVIETRPKTGSGVLEPWMRETVGAANRLESTLQSIRRRAFIHITPADGGYFVHVEVFKELEDVTGTTEKTAGGATFRETKPLQRDLNLVVGQSAPSGWIPQGRDPLLEERMCSALQAAFAQ